MWIKKEQWFTVLPLIEISNFCDIEIVDILSGIVESKLVVNLKTPDNTMEL